MADQLNPINRIKQHDLITDADVIDFNVTWRGNPDNYYLIDIVVYSLHTWATVAVSEKASTFNEAVDTAYTKFYQSLHDARG